MSKPLSDKVYDRMLRQIMSRRLKPGDEVNRRDIAERFGVSTAPVREAFQQLEFDGFLISRPRLGTMVRPISMDEVRDRLILREAIEAQAARIYCGEPVRKNRRRLLELAREVDAAPHDSVTNWRAEIRFHLALTALANSPLLNSTLELVMQHSLFHAVNEMLPFHEGNEGMDSHIRNHVLLVKGLQTDDPLQAVQMIHESLQSRVELADRRAGVSH